MCGQNSREVMQNSMDTGKNQTMRNGKWVKSGKTFQMLCYSLRMLEKILRKLDKSGHYRNIFKNWAIL